MGLFNRKKILSSIGNGITVPLSEVNDEVFSSGMMGTGFALKNHDGKIHSPLNGEITGIFPTKHAITIKGKDDTELLIHMGIDTVDLKGIPFDVNVENGQKVKQGELIATMDINYIKESNKDPIVILVIPEKENSQLLTEYERVEVNDKVFNY